MHIAYNFFLSQTIERDTMLEAHTSLISHILMQRLSIKLISSNLKIKELITNCSKLKERFNLLKGIQIK